MSNKERYERLQQLRATVAAQLGLPVENERVVVAAALRLHHESLMERLIAGKLPDTGDLLRTAEAILSACPPIETHKVTVEIVNPARTKCPRCAYEFDPDAPHRTKMLKQLASPPASPAADTKLPAPSTPSPAKNVVPLKQPPRSNS
jgi:hypothetical protein